MINKVKVLITGKSINYFLKNIINKEINIYLIDKYKDKLFIIIDYSDYLKLLDMKTTYKIKLIERYGLNKYKYLLNKYLIFIIFIVLGIIINIFLSNIIFKVEVNHPNKKLVKLIKKDLSKYGIKKYHFKVTYKDKELIKDKILSLEKDKIEWLEIENIGTKYIIKVEERKLNKKESICNPRNIVAKKKAIIMEIKSSSGEIVKKKNDYVEKDEVIISGLIHNKDKIVSKRCSIGSVYGETWYNVVVSVPKYNKKEVLLKDKTYSLYIKLFKNNLDTNKKLRTYKKSEYNIIESRIIPIKIGLLKKRKIKVIKNKYKDQDIEKIAINESLKVINKKLKQDESIISKKTLKKTEKNSKIEVDIFYKIKENITSYVDISNLNIEEMNTKEE